MNTVLVRLAYFARTTLRGLRATPITSAVAVVTIGVSLVLLGSFALLLQNMQELVDAFGGELRVTAYLEDGVSDSERDALAEIARTVEGVAEVHVVSQQEALERFRRGVGRGSALLEGLGENPLPASLELVLAPDQRSAAGMRRVVGALDGLAGISDLGGGQDWVEGYLRALSLVRGLAVGIGVILVLATLLIVANTIRLAIYARRDELEILSLVGASRGFVTTPFLLEGLLEGAAGGALALALLYGVFRIVLPGLEFGLELVLGGAAPRFFSAREGLMLLAAGASLGVFGSSAALLGERSS